MFCFVFFGRSAMYIQSNYNNVNMQGRSSGNNSCKKSWKSFIQKIKQKSFNCTPQIDLNFDDKLMEKLSNFDKRLSRPAENRLVMGTTALLTQPLIDQYNHRVDEETRTVSRNRTIAKIIAGTIIGILVRGSCYHIVKKMTNIKGCKKYEKWLLPNKNLEKFSQNPDLLENYRSALSTCTALLAMCYTNFALDAPLTVSLTNKFNQKSGIKEADKKERMVTYG